MERYIKITVEEYHDNKGELYGNENIYDSTGAYAGIFKGYDKDGLKFIKVELGGRQELFTYYQSMVEIEVTPIFVAL